MSEQEMNESQVESQSADSQGSDSSNEVKLSGLIAFKMGMTTVYRDSGESVAVTVLKYEPLYVSQLKTKEKEGYEAVQVAALSLKAKNARASQVGHDKLAGFEHGARIHREMRMSGAGLCKVGQTVSIQSLSKGDRVKLSAFSKGHGFSGVVKRWDFGGGPASHGSGFHRTPGSIGNRTWPGRVIAGKKMAGRWGNEKVSLKAVEVIDVLPDESVILVKGPIPGSRNSIVQMMKV